MEGIWQRYRKYRRDEDRNALLARYAHLADSHATRLARRLPPQIGEDEVRSAAYDGLLQAVERFDPGRQARFETFCRNRITGAVMDWLRAQDSQSRSVRNFEKRRDRVREAFGSTEGRPPTESELASTMRMSYRRFSFFSRMSRVGDHIPFSAIESQSSSKCGTVGRPWDIQDRRAPDPADAALRESVTDFLTRGLTRDERLVLILYYYENLTMAEIGQVLDRSESRVSQMHKDVIGRLRERSRSQMLTELAS